MPCHAHTRTQHPPLPFPPLQTFAIKPTVTAPPRRPPSAPRADNPATAYAAAAPSGAARAAAVRVRGRPLLPAPRAPRAAHSFRSTSRSRSRSSSPSDASTQPSSPRRREVTPTYYGGSGGASSGASQFHHALQVGPRVRRVSTEGICGIRTSYVVLPGMRMAGGWGARHDCLGLALQVG